MKKIAFLAPAVIAFLSGCATAPDTTSAASTVLGNTAKLRISEEKPVGYPRARMEKVAGMNWCLKSTEDWRKGSINGTTVWLLDEKNETMACVPVN